VLECQTKFSPLYEAHQNERQTKVARHTLTLIRHGQPEEHKSGSDEDPSLTELGRKQAEITGETLRDFEIDTIYHSTMARAQETAQIIARNFPDVPMIGSDDLREGTPIIPPKLTQWAEKLDKDDSSFKLSDVPLDRERIDKAFQQIFQPADETPLHDLVVCHGNVARYLVCRVLDINVDIYLQMKIDHCSLTRVVITPDGLQAVINPGETGNILLFYNESCHLSADIRTEG
jgi:serine/threonine-protein phosphatase PGAM5